MRGGNLIVDADEIDSIEADDYYAAIHTGGSRHLIRESLASLEHRLDRTQFVRAHRLVMVNIARVRAFRVESTGDTIVVLRDGTQRPVSRRRREQVAGLLRRLTE